MEKLRDSAARMATDGLNSMKYTVNKITEHLLYTQVKADVKKKIGVKSMILSRRSWTTYF